MTDPVIFDGDSTLPSPEGIAIEGMSFRHFRRPDDYAPLAALIGATNKAEGIPYVPNPDGLRNEYENLADFDPGRDLLLAEVDGRIIGFGQASRQVRDGIAVYWSFGTVLQEYRRRGLGRAILRANEARDREVALRFEDAGGRVFASWVDDNERGARELLASEGYEPARYGYVMRRAGLDDVPDVPMPDGLELRPVAPDQHRAIFEADEEAFRDHWGHREATEQDFVALYAEPESDTSLWRVAWDGDQVAGAVMSYIWRSENEELGLRRGWLERISVRRPWRRRGLARALIASALVGLREEGMEDAMLGVDTENLTGALGLYESMGFAVSDRQTHYRKAWS
ncbi:MAG: GNAT family N-acetyltransferase [Chloroflexi bacterium]|nr:GNAT family N-acetyltransferase [Chloroflexota bacterium]